jgi:DNA polymerase-3 subunit epsilon
MRITPNRLGDLARRARTGRVVAFDTETTGCSWRDEICQIAAVEYLASEASRTFAAYICPTCPMSWGAYRVHGLSMDFLRENGDAPSTAMRAFFDFVGDDALLVAHNSPFDMRMLRQECAKFGLDFAPRGLEICDSLSLSRRLLPGISHALGYLVDYLGVDVRNTHDALDDARACAAVFFALLDRAV